MTENGAQEIVLGPFLGGLNNATGVADTIGDTELAECIDFDYTVDGTLVTRPSVFQLPAQSPLNGNNLRILGVFIYGSTSYTVACLNDTDLYYRDNSQALYLSGWVLLSSGFGNAQAATQYGSKMWFCKTTSGGASWDGTTFTAVAAIPAGNSMEVFKERLWVSSGNQTSRLSFSAVGDFTSFPGTNFVDVGPGDGQTMQTIVAGVNSMYIFKSSSSYALSFDSDPARGSLQQISSVIGAVSPWAVTRHENIIYVLDVQFVYAIVGYQYQRINVKVDIAKNNAVVGNLRQKGVLSTVGDRILVQYQSKTYVYYPLTNTWTEWALPPTHKWFAVEQYVGSKGYPVYYTSINTTTGTSGGVGPFLAMFDGPWDSSIPVDLVNNDPTLTTKMFSFDTPYSFKRIMWWGADLIATSSSGQATVIMSLVPYNFQARKTWADISAFTWSALSAYTWNEATVYGGTVDNTVIVSAPLRKYVKANRSIRCTRVQFKVAFTGYDHTATSSIHHIVAAVKGKQSPQSRSEGAVQ